MIKHETRGVLLTDYIQKRILNLEPKSQNKKNEDWGVKIWKKKKRLLLIIFK